MIIHFHSLAEHDKDPAESFPTKSRILFHRAIDLRIRRNGSSNHSSQQNPQEITETFPAAIQFDPERTFKPECRIYFRPNQSQEI